jgi:hypothetical protein
LLGCVTWGAFHPFALPLALAGFILGRSARGNLRVAGLTLNLLVLIPAAVSFLAFLGLLGIGLSLRP